MAADVAMGAFGLVVLEADQLCPRLPGCSMPAPGTCKLGERDGQPVPDPQCTPGAIDAAVTEANLAATICKSDWREKAYPAVEVDTRMKADSARAYGLPPCYEGEYDHLVSRMLGGSSEDPRNRRPQPQAKPNPKDRIEIALHEGVCKGMISLAPLNRLSQLTGSPRPMPLVFN